MRKLLEGHSSAVKDVEVAGIVATVLVGYATASSIVIVVIVASAAVVASAATVIVVVVVVTGPVAVGYFILFCWI